MAKKEELQKELSRLNSTLSDYASRVATLELSLSENVAAVEQLNQAMKVMFGRKNSLIQNLGQRRRVGEQAGSC